MPYKLDKTTAQALNHLQNTQLDPMEEALFKSWAAANQIRKPDDPNDPTDYRGIYKGLQGQVLPWGTLKQHAAKANSQQTLMQVLQDRAREGQNSVQQQAEQARKDAMQETQHRRKMEQGQIALAKAPIDLQMKQIDLAKQQLGVEKQRLGVDGQQLRNEGQMITNQGKELDLEKELLNRSVPAEDFSPAPVPTPFDF